MKDLITLLLLLVWGFVFFFLGLYALAPLLRHARLRQRRPPAPMFDVHHPNGCAGPPRNVTCYRCGRTISAADARAIPLGGGYVGDTQTLVYMCRSACAYDALPPPDTRGR